MAGSLALAVAAGLPTRGRLSAALDSRCAVMLPKGDALARVARPRCRHRVPEPVGSASNRHDCSHRVRKARLDHEAARAPVGGRLTLGRGGDWRKAGYSHNADT